MAHERKCICCQTTYKYCPRCREHLSMETWHMLFCSENCRGIYKILESYKIKKITALEAQDQLGAFDLSIKEQLNAVLKNQVEEIFSVSRPKIRTRKKAKITVETVGEEQEVEIPADNCE